MAPTALPTIATLSIPLDLDTLQSVSETLEKQGGAAGTTTEAAPGTDPTKEAPPSGFGNLWMLLAIGAVIWFLIFAPERKARKQREEMLGALKKGDKVVTTGGLHGTIADIRENEVVIKAGDVRLTFSRTSVHQVAGDGDEA